MPDEKQQSNHERMMDQLRESYESIILTNPDLADDWKKNPKNSELPDPNLEEDFDFTPGAYDGWEPQDEWNTDDDEEEEKESHPDWKANLNKERKRY